MNAVLLDPNGYQARPICALFLSRDPWTRTNKSWSRWKGQSVCPCSYWKRWSRCYWFILMTIFVDSFTLVTAKYRIRALRGSQWWRWWSPTDGAEDKIEPLLICETRRGLSERHFRPSDSVRWSSWPLIGTIFWDERGSSVIDVEWVDGAANTSGSNAPEGVLC